MVLIVVSTGLHVYRTRDTFLKQINLEKNNKKEEEEFAVNIIFYFPSFG